MRDRRVIATYPVDYRDSLWSIRRARGNPLSFLEELASRREEVVPFSLAGHPAFLLKHPDLVEAVLVTDADKFVKSPGLQRATRLLGTGLLTAEGERHRQRRALVQPAFHRRRLDEYAAIIVAHGLRVRDRWRPGSIVDIAGEAGALTLSIVGEALFGADLESASAEVREAVRTASATLDPLVSLLAPGRRVRAERQRLQAVIDQLILEHLRSAAGAPSATLMSLLLDARTAESSESADQLRDDALTILLAGHDTIANALAWVWSLLADDRDAEALLEREVDGVLGDRPPAAGDMPDLAFTRAVLAEAMRLYPPAWVIARTACVAVDLTGHAIPQGAIVLISPYVLHRDPRFFADPSSFSPERWLRDRTAGRQRLSFIPFGAGPRACIGEGFAWMEGVLLLATFAQRWRLRRTEGGPLRARPQITLRPQGVGMTLLER